MHFFSVEVPFHFQPIFNISNLYTTENHEITNFEHYISFPYYERFGKIMTKLRKYKKNIYFKKLTYSSNVYQYKLKSNKKQLKYNL